MTIVYGHIPNTTSSGSTSSDASSENQLAGNAILKELKESLDKLNTSFGQPDVGVSSTVVATSPFMSLFKAVGWGVISVRDRLPPSIGKQVSSQSLSITPSSDSDLPTLSLQNTQIEKLGVIETAFKSLSPDKVSILSTYTSDVDGTSPVTFSGMTCVAMEITNDSGLDIEYSRIGSDVYFPIMARTTKRILGIKTTSEISLRRKDLSSEPLQIKAEVFY